MTKLSDDERRRFRQRIQYASDENFWDVMDTLHKEAFFIGFEFALKVAYLHPRISQRMVDEVRKIAEEKHWVVDDLKPVEVEDTIMKLITGREAICPECKRRLPDVEIETSNSSNQGS